jgi:hypothetical protein
MVLAAAAVERAMKLQEVIMWAAVSTAGASRPRRS